jgi:hypothetical protein
MEVGHAFLMGKKPNFPMHCQSMNKFVTREHIYKHKNPYKGIVSLYLSLNTQFIPLVNSE